MGSRQGSEKSLNFNTDGKRQFKIKKLGAVASREASENRQNQVSARKQLTADIIITRDLNESFKNTKDTKHVNPAPTVTEDPVLLAPVAVEKRSKSKQL